MSKEKEHVRVNGTRDVCGSDSDRPATTDLDSATRCHKCDSDYRYRPVKPNPAFDDPAVRGVLLRKR